MNKALKLHLKDTFESIHEVHDISVPKTKWVNHHIDMIDYLLKARDNRLVKVLKKWYGSGGAQADGYNQALDDVIQFIKGGKE